MSQEENGRDDAHPAEYADEHARSPWRPPRWVKLVVSGLLIYHLAAVVAPPASVAPSSRLFQWLMFNCFRHYTQAMYLNHGYQFFAPEVGPSALISYTVTTRDGEQTTERIPNTDIRPRLLYHRHFMLTERLGEWGENAPPSYAKHLLHKYDCERVGLTRITHLQPPMEMVADGVTLTDPRGYREQSLGVFERKELLNR